MPEPSWWGWTGHRDSQRLRQALAEGRALTSGDIVLLTTLPQMRHRQMSQFVQTGNY